MHPSLTVYKKSVLDFIHADFEIRTLAGDCRFTEGPVWNSKGYYLFSDTPTNCIYRITEDRPKEVFLTNSGTDHPDDPDLDQERKQVGSNALAYDRDGYLLVCQHGGHGIARYDGTRLQPYIGAYRERPFNSPNDLILHRDGRIYFSDPPYGLKGGGLNPEKYQPLAGVYCWQQGEMQLVCDRFKYPNGVCLSDDQRTLYICSSKPFEKFILRYDTSSNQFLDIFAEENSDGIEVDRYDHVYLCTKEGLIILDKNGERMALLQLPSVPANICWGGEDGDDLFIAARENIFLIKNLQKRRP